MSPARRLDNEPVIEVARLNALGEELLGPAPRPTPRGWRPDTLPPPPLPLLPDDTDWSPT